MNRKHLLTTVAGWLLPLAVLAFIFLFKVQVHPMLLLGLALLCPLSHLLVMGSVGHDHDLPRPVPVHARSTDRR